MPRPKGPGAIKFLDPAKQDAVAMRRVLWRGHTARTPLDDKVSLLNALSSKKAALIAERREEQERLRRVESSHGPYGSDWIKTYRREREARRKVKRELHRIEQALGDTARQIEAIQREINEQKTAVFAWQEKAVQLIELHSYIGAGRGPVVIGDKKRNSKVCTTKGATISTRELQKQLREYGFKVGDRELRRFMRRCGGTGRQGARTDLA
jgi:hypothetical protein